MGPSQKNKDKYSNRDKAPSFQFPTTQYRRYFSFLFRVSQSKDKSLKGIPVLKNVLDQLSKDSAKKSTTKFNLPIHASIKM